MNRRIRTILCKMLLLAVAACVTACEDDDASSSLTGTPQVTVMFSLGGVGDGGYNDQILRGVQRVAKANEEVEMRLVSPDSVGEVEKRLAEWIAEPCNGRSLFVLAGNDYERLLDEYSSEISQLDNGKSLIMFETFNTYGKRICTFRLDMYGACFLAGKSVAYMQCDVPLVLLANSSDKTLKSSLDGFVAGYGGVVDVEYLADDSKGYNMQDEVYGQMMNYAQKYDYIFGVVGGSNYGIYRYMREYPWGRLWTAGMDVDQSTLSNKITGSVVKHVDRLVEDYLLMWIDGKELPEHKTYGLESGYMEWLVAPEYEDFFGSFVVDNIDEAIRKEKEYEGE